MTSLFEPVELGKLTLSNRLALAPMTRSRAGADGVPAPYAADYYAQRAGLGLLISEGVQPSAVGQGYLNTPGLHTDAQQQGWAEIADAVHAKGSVLFVQLMHAGRIGHPDNKLDPDVVAPSALAAPGEIVTAEGPKAYPVPRALDTEEISGVIQEYVDAARRAIAAGIDGIEVHGANGYLVHQFLAPSSNERTDSYGGSPESRARFAIEVTRAVAEAIGPERTAIRISPSHNIQGAIEDDADETATAYRTLVDALAPLGLAYLSILADPRDALIRDLVTRFDGPVVLNNGFADVTTAEWAQQVLDEGLGHLVAVGRQAIANPDLVERWKTGAALNEVDQNTVYASGPEGYTDYPALS